MVSQTWTPQWRCPCLAGSLAANAWPKEVSGAPRNVINSVLKHKHGSAQMNCSLSLCLDHIGDFNCLIQILVSCHNSPWRVFTVLMSLGTWTRGLPTPHSPGQHFSHWGWGRSSSHLLWWEQSLGTHGLAIVPVRSWKRMSVMAHPVVRCCCPDSTASGWAAVVGTPPSPAFLGVVAGASSKPAVVRTAREGMAELLHLRRTVLLGWCDNSEKL